MSTAPLHLWTLWRYTNAIIIIIIIITQNRYALSSMCHLMILSHVVSYISVTYMRY